MWNYQNNSTVAGNAPVRERLRSARDAGAPWAFELLVLFALLLLVEFALPGHASLAAINPHPFWIPVLLLSAQYGVSGGLAAALTAIAVSSVVGWPAQAGIEDFYDYSRRIWREPIMWLAAAVVLGGLRSQQIARFEALRCQMVDAMTQRQDIATFFNSLKEHCEDIERQMACSQDRSIEAGFSVLASLSNSTPKTFHSELSTAIDLLLGPATYSLMLYRDAHFVERLDYDNGSGINRRLPVEVEAALLRGGRVLSIMRDADAGILDGTGLFAAPIVEPGSDRVLGALVIEKMEAARIGERIETTLTALATAIAGPLGTQQVVVNFERTDARGSGVHASEERMAVSRNRAPDRASENASAADAQRAVV